MRSGHLKLKEFLCNRLKRVQSPNCTHCGVPENLEHLLRNCTGPERVIERDRFIKKAKESYEEEYQERVAQDDAPSWKPAKVDYHDPYEYLFRCRLNQERERDIIKEMIRVVRKSIGNNHWSNQ